MAVGDAAAAKGLLVWPVTQPHSQGVNNDNQRGDDIAAEIDARAAAVAEEAQNRAEQDQAEANARVAADNALRTSINNLRDRVLPIELGGTGAETAAAARAALGVQASGTVWTGGVNTSALVRGSAGFAVGTTGKGFSASGQAIVNPLGVAGGIAAVLAADGTLGISSSSARFKRDIQDWTPDKQALLAMQLVTFHYTEAYAGTPDAPLEYGMIAEEINDLGLTWLVYYDDDGAPLGIHYDRIALALVAVVQDHEARLAALESKGAK